MNHPVGLVELVAQLHSLASPETAAKQQLFGITGANHLGIPVPDLRKIARGRRDHELALGLWQTGIHEARILASLVDEAGKVTRDQMESWAHDFDSWDICDGVCCNLFYKPPFAVDFALAWSNCAFGH